MNLEKPRIRVDFNDLVQRDLILVSQFHEVLDATGNKIELTEGLEVSVYEFNHYQGGRDETIFAEGVIELVGARKVVPSNANAKWYCRINENGVQVKESAQGN